MNEDNGKGYGCFVMFVSGVAIIFSIAALLRHDNWNCEISPAGFVIATLSALITFVVAWQIWQVIDTKDTVKKAEEAHKKLKKLERSLEQQQNLFNQHNLEIKNLIDAHAKISEAAKTTDLPNKYIAYAEALDLLLQSNVGISYEQFNHILHELSMITMEFSRANNLEDAWNIIASEKEFNWHYTNIIAKLEQRSDEIEAFRRELTIIKDLREAAINDLKTSAIGKQALQVNAELAAQRKHLEAKYAARKAAEAQASEESKPDNPTP